MRYVALVSLVLMAGCDSIRATSDRLFGGTGAQPEPAVAEAPVDAVEVDDAGGVEQVAAGPGWTGARQTIAGLGDPTKPGRWMETPLVQVERNGRVVSRKTGAQAYVTLIPVPGDPGAGSRLSLDAMRALLEPIDQLVELDVYAN
ncbi:MAG: hypothetical protein AB3N21_20770 [Ruegeria sp.]|uniref:hypothetical protein n=1 Tax=Ruegeria sp. TaxID=1879320 RepID=UPI00349EC08E